MSAVGRVLGLLALALGSPNGACQSFHYVEPGLAACPAPPAPSTGAPKTVRAGAALRGSLRVDCGLDQGSYTVTLHASDPGAHVVPKSFIVNFGRLVGPGGFTVRFSTLGPQRISASITSNMGSPAVQGQFASAASEFLVVAP